MALADRKIPEVFNKKTGGSKDARSITNEKELEIKAEYDAGVHIADDGMLNTIAPALYAIQKLSEDIDELRRFVSGEVTSISTSQANAITANTAKTTFPGFGTSSGTALEGDTTTITTTQANEITANTAKVSQGLATASHTMQFDVANDGRGNYTLRITIVDSSGKAPVTKTVDLTLR